MQIQLIPEEIQTTRSGSTNHRVTKLGKLFIVNFAVLAELLDTESGDMRGRDTGITQASNYTSSHFVNKKVSL